MNTESNLPFSKKYLSNKRDNNGIKRQVYLEDYITTQNYFINPKIYYDDNEIIFADGFSILIINSKFFSLDTPLFKKIEKGAYQLSNKLSITDLKHMHRYINDATNVFGKKENSMLIIKEIENLAIVNYLKNEELKKEFFDLNELECINAILDNPRYSMSLKKPILKAESNIGKAYIYSLKK